MNLNQNFPPLEIGVEPELGKIDVPKLYKLPSELQFCKSCVISNQRPRIVFDAEGVCNACRFAERKHNKIDWAQRDQELRDLCDRFRRKDGRHDVIVPSSGGKDSAVVAHKLKYEFGMNPLTVTWSPHFYTEIGWYNFQGLIHSGLDNLLATPNGEVHRKLTRLAFAEMGEPFQPFIYGQVSYPLQIAVRYGIPLIMDGENGEAEYGGDSDTEDKPGFTAEDAEKYWFSGRGVESWKEYGLTDADLQFYKNPELELLFELGVERHFWSYYKKWVPQEHYYYAAEHTGFKANPEGRSEGTYSKYASLDDRIDGFHYYLMLLKFGIGRATSDAAHEIRDGHIARDEGVALVTRYDTEFPEKYFNDFLDYCQITEEYFWDVCERWRNEKLWEKSGNKWRLKRQVT
jgi:N-acetyl sugar amidotransferase